MKKVSVKTLKANWEKAGNPTPWQYVTSAQLAEILGTHIQTISNWKLRKILPKPATNNPRLRGNRNYYTVSSIMAWLEGKTETEFYEAWLKANPDRALWN